MEEEFKNKKRTQWYLVNVKARENQTPSHYVDLFDKINSNDPMIQIPRSSASISVDSMTKSEEKDKNGIPNWILLKLMSYVIVDPNAFYNKETKEDISFEDWDENVVSNKKTSELLFIPSKHCFAVYKSSKISLKNIVYYMEQVAESIEPETYDINIICDTQIIEEKLNNAYSIISVDARLSYSNPESTEEFTEAFDNSLRADNACSADIKLRSAHKKPLKFSPNGIIKSLVSLSKKNGVLDAVITEKEKGKSIKISSEKYPLLITIDNFANGVINTIRNKIQNSEQ